MPFRNPCADENTTEKIEESATVDEDKSCLGREGKDQKVTKGLQAANVSFLTYVSVCVLVRFWST